MAKRRISRARVIEAALEVVEAQGVEGLSIRSVAARLGIEGMSLYSYIINKADLAAAAADALLAKLVLPEASLPWLVRFEQLLNNFYALATAHPRSFGLLHAAMGIDFADLNSEPRLNLAVDQILREIKMPSVRIFTVRRVIIIGMLGNAQADVQAMLNLERALGPGESSYEEMTKMTLQLVQDFYLELKDKPFHPPVQSSLLKTNTEESSLTPNPEPLDTLEHNRRKDRRVRVKKKIPVPDEGVPTPTPPQE